MLLLMLNNTANPTMPYTRFMIYSGQVGALLIQPLSVGRGRRLAAVKIEPTAQSPHHHRRERGEGQPRLFFPACHTSRNGHTSRQLGFSIIELCIQ